jgi:hypothetical protein
MPVRGTTVIYPQAKLLHPKGPAGGRNTGGEAHLRIAHKADSAGFADSAALLFFCTIQAGWRSILWAECAVRRVRAGFV